MRWLVFGTCGLAMVLGVVLGSVDRDGGPRPAPSDPAIPEPTPTTPDPSDEERTSIDELRTDAIPVTPLSGPAEQQVWERCFEVHPDADPALSPDPSLAGELATASSGEAGVIVWGGPAPDIPTALGTCLAVPTGDNWELVGRSWRPDPGAATTSLVWVPGASVVGNASALVGRVPTATAEALVQLGDGRVFRQDVVDGLLAVAWSPVAEPERVVLLDARGGVLADGAPTSL